MKSGMKTSKVVSPDKRADSQNYCPKFDGGGCHLLERHAMTQGKWGDGDKTTEYETAYGEDKGIVIV